jgi:hypothetical protein
MNLRKLTITKETIFGDAGKTAAQPITRAVALAVLENPFAGTFVDDLRPQSSGRAARSSTVRQSFTRN